MYLLAFTQHVLPQLLAMMIGVTLIPGLQLLTLMVSVSPI
jgi:hypothetical protein